MSTGRNETRCNRTAIKRKCTMKASDFFRGKYLKAADLVGKNQNFTIRKVETGEFTGENGPETKPILQFAEHAQGLVLNKTNLGVLTDLFGDDLEKWAGKTITLFGDQTKFKGRPMATIRVKETRKAA
jgi:hypothetical protein